MTSVTCHFRLVSLDKILQSRPLPLTLIDASRVVYLHYSEATLQNGQNPHNRSDKYTVIPLAVYFSSQFWFWLTIWTFCGQGMHVATRPCNSTSSHSCKKCEKSNLQKSPVPPLRGSQNNILTSPTANPFSLPDFSKLHSSFTKKENLISAKSKQSLFSTSQKENRTHTETSFFWKANLESCFRFSTEFHFFPKTKTSVQQNKISYPLCLVHNILG